MKSIENIRKRKKIRVKKNRSKLGGVPQRRGVVIKVSKRNPKKPNSANRRVAKVRLSNGKEVLSYVVGEGGRIEEHNIVIVREGKLQDTPGVRTKIIRGVEDMEGVKGRIRGRSKYGVRKSKEE